METLKRIYYNPATGFLSAQKLYQKAKPEDRSITHKLVQSFLAQQETAQIHHERRKASQYPLLASTPFARLQIDLLDVSKENPNQNRCIKFLFLAIDVYSRYVFCIPIKSKTEAECLRAIKAILTSVADLGYDTTQLDSDNESAFLSRSFKELCSEHNIIQNLAEPGDHASLGVIDRFCRTLRNLISKYQTARQTQKYIDVLPELISNYNSTFHSTLKETPERAISQGGITNYIRQQTAKASNVSYNRTDYKIGDRVRLLIKKTLFEKGGSRFTKSIHTITGIQSNTFLVSDRVGGYRKSELQRVGEVESAPHQLDDDEPPADLEAQRQEQKIERRITRRVAKEGVPLNRAPPPTDEEKSLRAIRRRPRDRGPYLS